MTTAERSRRGCFQKVASRKHRGLLSGLFNPALSAEPRLANGPRRMTLFNSAVFVLGFLFFLQGRRERDAVPGYRDTPGGRRAAEHTTVSTVADITSCF